MTVLGAFRYPRLLGRLKSVSRLIRLGGLTLAVATLLLAGHSAHAQNTGTIFGTVQDQSGALVKGAAVAVADKEHGVNRQVMTTDAGEFTLPELPIGKYTLVVSKDTFAKKVIADIALDANGSVKEVVTLTLGSANDAVTVVDQAGDTIDTRSAMLGTMIDQKLIEDLPIDGHNVVALTALLPGVTGVNAPTTFTGDTAGPTFNASGSRNTQNLMLFDGLMWNNLFYNTGINYPPPNSLQEVSVVLNNYKAQYGRNSGSVMNVLTKSGTNIIHGSAWDYIQNQMFNATDYLSKVNPQDEINQIGFTVGGPILKDKLFYFVGFQDLIGHLQTTGLISPIGLAERGLNPDGVTARPCTSGGPFSGMTCASFIADATGGKILNPIEVSSGSGNGATPQLAIANFQSAWTQAGNSGTTPCADLMNQAASYAGTHPITWAPGTSAQGTIQGTYLPFGEMPTTCLNPVMLKVMNTFTPSAVNAAHGQASTVSSAPTGDKNLLARLDYQVARGHSIDVRYDMIDSTATGPKGVNSSSTGVSSYALLYQQALSNFGNVGWAWIISPNLLNTLRFGYKRFETTQTPLETRTLNDFGGNFVEPGLPTMPAINFSNQFSLGSTSQGYQDHINENVELEEAMSWTHGRHSIMGGFSFFRLQYLTRSDYPGSFNFSSTYTGVSVADGMLGLLSSVQAQNRLIQGGIQHEVNGFVQDDWRLTSRLTLNLGFRYELPFQWFEPHGEAATFIPGIQSVVFPNAIGGLGFPGDPGVLPSLVPTDFNGVAPRLGFAYDVTGAGSLIVRGGAGIFFDAVNASVVGVGEPYHYIFNTQDPAGGASVPLQANIDGPITQVPASFDPKNPQFIGPYSITFPDRNFRTPYSEAANFGIEYKIAHGGTLDTNWVGKFAHKLVVPIDLNPAIYDCSGGYFQADPAKYCNNANNSAASEQARLRYTPFNYGGQGIVDIQSIGNASYNALQMQYTQRGGKYLNLLTSYTFSRAIDVDTNGQTTSNAVPNVYNIRSDRGLSDYQAKHIYTLGWVVRYPSVSTGLRAADAVLNHWVYSGTYQAHSGNPFSVTINGDQALDDEPNQRAALVPGVSPLLPSNRHRADKVLEYINRDAFTYPTTGTFSPVGRNSFIGPGYIMTNMTMGRDFPLARVREGMRLNVRAEAFNVFNTPNLGKPQTGFSCSTTKAQGMSCPAAGGSYPLNAATGLTTFGSILNTYGNNANTSTNGRKMQFAATIFF